MERHGGATSHAAPGIICPELENAEINPLRGTLRLREELHCKAQGCTEAACPSNERLFASALKLASLSRSLAAGRALASAGVANASVNSVFCESRVAPH